MYRTFMQRLKTINERIFDFELAVQIWAECILIKKCIFGIKQTAALQKSQRVSVCTSVSAYLLSRPACAHFLIFQIFCRFLQLFSRANCCTFFQICITRGLTLRLYSSLGLSLPCPSRGDVHVESSLNTHFLIYTFN